MKVTQKPACCLYTTATWMPREQTSKPRSEPQPLQIGVSRANRPWLIRRAVSTLRAPGTLPVRRYCTNRPLSGLDQSGPSKKLPGQIELINEEGGEDEKVFLLSQLANVAYADGALVEAESRDTWENAHASAQRLAGLGVDRVLLVTHAFHMPRALISADAAGIDAVPAPCCFEHTPPALRKPGTMTDWLPTPGVLGKSYLMLHEMAGLAWYGLFRG